MNGPEFAFQVGTALLDGDPAAAELALNDVTAQDLADAVMFLIGGMFGLLSTICGLPQVPLEALTVEHRAVLLVEWRRAAVKHARREAGL